MWKISNNIIQYEKKHEKIHKSEDVCEARHSCGFLRVDSVETVPMDTEEKMDATIKEPNDEAGENDDALNTDEAVNSCV